MKKKFENISKDKKIKTTVFGFSFLFEQDVFFRVYQQNRPEKDYSTKNGKRGN